jgi:glyoxylase-like metal-dependent hydrolase (beta-lactamase superfamily II)
VKLSIKNFGGTLPPPPPLQPLEMELLSKAGLAVKQLENELMKSNCFIITDWATHSCVIIDPGSEKSEREIEYIKSNQLRLDYIILTHEHTDHTWGANALKERFPLSKLVCSEVCDKYAKKDSRAYFLFYYDDPNYRYELKPADVVVKSDEDVLLWNKYNMGFIQTPGHSRGSMCIKIENMLFTGDTIMPFKPFFNGRGSNEDNWVESVIKIKNIISLDVIIYPGHGERLSFAEWLNIDEYHLLYNK